MPNISKIKSGRKFTKRSYRAYDINGDNINNYNKDKITKINPKDIIKWEYKDRLENEMGDIDDLVNSIKNNQQQVPCIVRPKENKYELIAGERRWIACTKLDVDMLCIVKDINDMEASIIQALENEKREGLSDYAKGMSYADKISKGILVTQDIVFNLGISKLDVSRLLAFSKIDSDVSEKVKDFSKVSSRTAAEINRMTNKGDAHKEIILSLADKIRDGKIGSTSLAKYIESKLKPKEEPLRSLVKGKTMQLKQTGNVYQININKNIIKNDCYKAINIDKLAVVIDNYINEEIVKVSSRIL